MIQEKTADGAVLILNAGHNEYGISEAEPVWDAYEDIKEVDLDAILAASHHHYLWYDEDLRDWGTLVRLEGSVEELVKAFNTLAADLAVAPSGDDSAFDYWPSGMRMLWEFALDLSQWPKANDPYFIQTYRDTVQAVLNQEWDHSLGQFGLVVSEWEGIPLLPSMAFEMVMARYEAMQSQAKEA